MLLSVNMSSSDRTDEGKILINSTFRPQFIVYKDYDTPKKCKDVVIERSTSCEKYPHVTFIIRKQVTTTEKKQYES